MTRLANEENQAGAPPHDPIELERPVARKGRDRKVPWLFLGLLAYILASIVRHIWLRY
jgi:hypothetical protein